MDRKPVVLSPSTWPQWHPASALEGLVNTEVPNIELASLLEASVPMEAWMDRQFVIVV